MSQGAHGHREDADRQARAVERLGRAWVRRTTLGAEDLDPDPIFGEAAFLLAVRLSDESWALTGQPMPSYARADTPCRFVADPMP